MKKLNHILILLFVGFFSLSLAWGGGKPKDPGRCPFCARKEETTSNRIKSYKTKRQPNFSDIGKHVSTRHPEEYQKWADSRGKKSKSAVGENQDKGDISKAQQEQMRQHFSYGGNLILN